MIKLSTGQDSTLGNYHKLCIAFFGKNSAQTGFIEEKMAKSSNGENEEVVAEEGQMLHLLGSLPSALK